ncbi:MAG: FAD-binding protein [Bacteroidales bacterium]|nr:FAD-binding protein [Bacteroidales bacterium]
MQKEIVLELSPEDASHEIHYKRLIVKKLGITADRISKIQIIRKSIDARRRRIRMNMAFRVFIDREPSVDAGWQPAYQNVEKNREVLVIGSGPAGLFAALRLIELGIRPVIIERGKPVEDRKKDIILLEHENILTPDSNYCFGEGGAGTFSDGKLYTRAKKKGDHYRILEILCFHGADESILYEAHPHIGSDRLPAVVAGIRKTILVAGGIILFNTKVSDFIVKNNNITGIVTSGNEKLSADATILATGHSARDIYHLLSDKGIRVENKPFAMGVRVEHPQQLIDRIQYHGQKSAFLPAATYNVAQQVSGRGVYSFCMCPGGQIVPANTAAGEIVVNGMSDAMRDSPYANSGLVVQILPSDYKEYDEYGGLAALRFQANYERDAFEASGHPQVAPAQRMTDFMRNRSSSTLPENSYLPGVVSSPMHRWMPDFIVKALQAGFREIDKRMRGFITEDAIMTGVESRTSSPVRIPRNPDTGEHIRIKGLFPCGEGSGYAGGIVSSALDGEQAADKCKLFLDLIPVRLH